MLPGTRPSTDTYPLTAVIRNERSYPVDLPVSISRGGNLVALGVPRQINDCVFQY
jgi:hypothetical protein